MFESLDFGSVESFGSNVEASPVVEQSSNTPVGSFVQVDLDGIDRRFTKDDAGYEEACKVQEALKILEEKKSLKAAFDIRTRAIDSEIADIRAKMQAKIDVLAEEKANINIEAFDINRDVRVADRELRAAYDLLRRALEADRLSKQYKDQSNMFDELTINMPWRDRILPHQIEGAKQLAIAGSAILADEMGLGKSLTSLATADMLMVKRLLIIVPDDVVSNFVKEVNLWAPHREPIQLGKMSKGQRQQIITMAREHLNEYTMVLNYSAWRRDFQLLEGLKTLRFEMMILDEAHGVKETTTNAYRGVHEIRMASNSCPECRNAVGRRKNKDGVLNPGGYMVRNPGWEHYYCPVETCGWSEVKDIENDTKRDAGYMRSVRYCLPMTGTVILNKPTDIFALLSLIEPEVFAEKHRFVAAYCQTNPWTNKVEFKSGGLESLTVKLAGKYVARDRKSAGVILPKQEIVYHNIDIDPDQYPDQYRVIKQLTEHAMVMLSTGKQLPILATIALITRKRQANVWPAGITLKDEDDNVIFNTGDEIRESIKLDRLIDHNNEGLLPDLTADGNMAFGQRVVVFSQFKTPLVELEKRLNAAGISTVRFDGDTPQEIRKQVKIDFDRRTCEVEGYEPKWQVVLCNYRTGGVGLNFTSATQMVILDQEWNPGKESQAFGRMDRIGQTEETTVHVLQLNRTIDTWMHDLIEEKRDMISGFNANMELQTALLEGLRGDGQI